MLKVLHWYPNLLLSAGNDGVYHAVKRLSEAQADLGAEVAIAAVRTPSTTREIHEKIELLECDAAWSACMLGSHLRWLTNKTIAELRNFAPDVVHAHGDFNLDNWWLPKVFNCPLVFSPHGAFHPEVISKGRKALKQSFLTLAKPFFYQKTALFHACCPMEGEHISQLLPRARVCCLPLGPSHDLLASGRSRANQEEITYTFIGRLDIYTKGLDILLESFALTAERLQRKCCLNLIGPDQARGQYWLGQRARELKIADLVHFKGSLSGEEMENALADTDIYVQLSRHEGFSMSAVEALLSCLPTILSSPMGVVSIPEIQSLPHIQIVQPNREEAANAMLDFALRLPEVKGAAVRAHAQLSSMFSWNRIAQSLLSQYQELVADRNEVNVPRFATNR